MNKYFGISIFLVALFLIITNLNFPTKNSTIVSYKKGNPDTTFFQGEPLISTTITTNNNQIKGTAKRDSSKFIISDSIEVSPNTYINYHFSIDSVTGNYSGNIPSIIKEIKEQRIDTLKIKQVDTLTINNVEEKTDWTTIVTVSIISVLVGTIIGVIVK